MALLLLAISQAPRLPSSCFWEAPLICWNILSRGLLLRAVFLEGVEMGGLLPVWVSLAHSLPTTED